MDFSWAQIWDMTKLFVRNPSAASARVSQMGWPVNVSVLMIVLAGVISGVMWAVEQALFGAAPQSMLLPDGREVMVAPATPLTVGVFSAIVGVVFSYMIYFVGVRSGGRGSLSGVMAVMAALQIALTVLGVIAGFLGIALPLLGFGLALALVYISMRGYAHAVMQAHGFDGMGRSIMVLLAALVLAMVVVLMVSLVLMPVLMPNMLSGI